jgi:hypothetical protein
VSESERAWLGEHFGICSDCRYYRAELGLVAQGLKAWETSVAPPVVTAELAAQWQMAIHAEARRSQAEAASASERETRTWVGIDRAVPISLVMVWLVTIGIHLNTPALGLEKNDIATPTLLEVRMVMEWLLAEKDAV